MFFDRIAKSPLFRRADHSLHGARFAYPHELEQLIAPALVDGNSLLLGVWGNKRPLRVAPQPTRPELGNLGVVARTRGGKGLLAKAQILTWRGSLLVNDIKGDLYEETAGHKREHSDVYVFDTRGLGHRFDPLQGQRQRGRTAGNGRIPASRAPRGAGDSLYQARGQNADPAVQSGAD